MKDQKGFGALGVLLIVLVVAALGFGGWYVAKNKEDKKQSVSTNSSQTDTNTSHNDVRTSTLPDTAENYQLIKAAITEQSTFCANQTADFSASPATLKVVAPTAAFNVNDNAVMTTDADFSRVAFSCKGGTQGEIAVLQKVTGNWKLLAEDASTIMPCSKVDGKKLPVVILKECFANEQAAADPRPIKD